MLQKKKYYRGIGGGEQFMNRMFSGMTGWGCSDQIKDVYQVRLLDTASQNPAKTCKYCCQHLTRPDDELFLFGFSRGACTYEDRLFGPC
jgi:predicted esterase